MILNKYVIKYIQLKSLLSNEYSYNSNELDHEMFNFT